jgi:uncharacterized protein (TIGR04255 family)
LSKELSASKNLSTAFEIYQNAPITEAVLDIRTRLAEPSLARLSVIRDDRYPNLFQTPNLMAFSFSMTEGNPALNTTTEPLGFSYRSADEKNIFQVRKDGFTHNRLAPYTEWKAFSAEAKRLWILYKEAAEPTEMELIGLNYINEIYIPFGVSFEDYFGTYIEVPSSLPQMLTSFSFSYQIPLPDEVGVLQIAQGYGPFKKPDHSTIILNIQVFRQINRKCSDVSEDELWAMFENLRIAKTKAFESCITDNVRAMIR